jgi:hypothetical protein
MRGVVQQLAVSRVLTPCGQRLLVRNAAASQVAALRRLHTPLRALTERNRKHNDERGRWAGRSTQAGMEELRKSTVLPLATGMTVTVALVAMRKRRPVTARFVVPPPDARPRHAQAMVSRSGRGLHASLLFRISTERRESPACGRG